MLRLVVVMYLIVILSWLSDISRVSDQNGISPLYFIVDVYHSGRKPLIHKRENSISVVLLKKV